MAVGAPRSGEGAQVVSRFIATYWRNQNLGDTVQREIEADIHTMSEVAEHHTPEGYELFEVGQGSRETLSDNPQAPNCACGHELTVRDEFDHRIMWDCDACGRQYLQDKWDEPMLWHDEQPQCACGHHAAYQSVTVSPRAGEVGTNWECRKCGKHWQIANGTTIAVERRA